MVCLSLFFAHWILPWYVFARFVHIHLFNSISSILFQFVYFNPFRLFYSNSSANTLQHLQQPINVYIDQDEECYFRVIGTHSVHLTGNFVISPSDIKDESEEEGEEDERERLLKKVLKEDDKRQNKKLKTNAGQAAPGASQDKKPEVKETKKEKNAKEVKKEEPNSANGKKVQFAEKLEQGPTPSKAPPSGKRTVSGIQIEDKKTGEGPAAKKGDRVAMRYIGKLKDGKVFDGMLLIVWYLSKIH